MIVAVTVIYDRSEPIISWIDTEKYDSSNIVDCALLDAIKNKQNYLLIQYSDYEESEDYLDDDFELSLSDDIELAKRPNKFDYAIALEIMHE